MGSKAEHDDGGKDLVPRYEELRAQALEACDRPSRALGWALFVRKGMAAWLETWQEHERLGESERIASGRLLSETGHEQQDEIVKVWTGMVMGQLPRVIACTP